MKPEGWGPWNVRAVNALVHLHRGLELRIGIKTPDGKEHWELRWKQMERLGSLPESVNSDRTIDRSGAINIRLQGERIRLGFSASGSVLQCEIEPLTEGAKAFKLLKRTFHPESMREGGTISQTRSITVGPLSLPIHKGRPVPVPESFDDGPLTLNDVIRIRCDADVRAKGINPATVVPTVHDTDDLDEILWRGVAWNTIYHPRLKRLMTPVSRDWCVDENNFGDYVLFPWDTFFCSLLASRRDKDLAYANVRAMLAEMTDRGMLPNVNGGAGQTLDRSQPPVGAYCVWKLHQKFNDLEFLAEVYPPLKRWHAFWMKYRDGNGDGLLEWGSDPIPAPVDWWKPHTQQAAKWESGLDNSPMYEDIPFNEEANTLELADIGLSCLYAADADALANIAEALGLADEAASYRAEYAQVSKRINEDLWDEEHGIYCNRHWDGRMSERWSPTSFYALYAGVATPERAERCVREHLMNPDEFWGEWVIPSISRKDANFPVQKYWQGRVWPPMNFLCYEGLRRCGFHAEADELAAKSEALFLKEWREEGHIHENYNAITADGDDVNPDDPEGSSDPIYTWGGLLAYIALDARERAT